MGKVKLTPLKKFGHAFCVSSRFCIVQIDCCGPPKFCRDIGFGSMNSRIDQEKIVEGSRSKM